MATEKNVHIFLIIHPKKVEDDTNLNVASIFGTAKSTQEADSVMILQKSELPNLRNIQIKKNRYDGDIGSQHLAFYPENKRYFEITNFEHQVYTERGGSIESLVSHRKKKFDGEIEPQLASLAEENPRSDLQNYKYRGPQSKIQDMLEQDLD
jgi:twinkle protein